MLIHKAIPHLAFTNTGFASPQWNIAAIGRNWRFFRLVVGEKPTLLTRRRRRQSVESQGPDQIPCYQGNLQGKSPILLKNFRSTLRYLSNLRELSQQFLRSRTGNYHPPRIGDGIGNCTRSSDIYLCSTSGGGTSLIRWGSAGLAFVSGNTIYLLDGPMERSKTTRDRLNADLAFHEAIFRASGNRICHILFKGIHRTLLVSMGRLSGRVSMDQPLMFHKKYMLRSLSEIRTEPEAPYTNTLSMPANF